jgi:adenylate cyclase
MQGTSPFMGKVRFGCCVLDDGRGTLKAPDGTETVLRPKTLDLLRLMLRNSGRVVARQEILDAVWPNLFVTDDSITQCVVEIRKAMGGGGTDLLKTVPRRGYLMTAEVAVDAANGNIPLLTGAATMPVDRPSIAVLPFRKEATDPQEAYFADGIIEGIVHVLSGLERITVVSRGSALALAESTVDPREVGQRLGVRYALYGGVRRAGDKLRITTELSETDTGAIIRSDRYDGDASDIFALQDRIAEQVVATIAPQVRERELARALRKPPANLTAYDLVLRALDRMHRLDRASFMEARELFERAIGSDPSYALAYSYLSWWHALNLAQGWSSDVNADRAAASGAAVAAIERDPHDALALTARGYELGYAARQFHAAEALFDRAVSISPSCALAWCFGGALRCWMERGEEAVTWAARAVRLAPHDPFTFLYQHILSQAHYTAGNYEEAALWGQRSAQLNPRHTPSWRTMMAALVALERFDELAEPLRHALKLEPQFSLRVLATRTPLQGPMRELFVERLRRAGFPD